MGKILPITPLEQLRKGKRESQQYIADTVLGCQLKTYRGYEKNRASIPSDQLIKLAEHFNSSTDYILGLESQPTHIETDIYEHIGLTPKSVNVLSKWKNSKKHKQNIRALNDILEYENEKYMDFINQSIFHYIWEILHSVKMKGMLPDTPIYRYFDDEIIIDPETKEKADKPCWDKLKIGDIVTGNDGTPHEVTAINVVNNRLKTDKNKTDMLYYKDPEEEQPLYLKVSDIIQDMAQNRVIEILKDIANSLKKV